MSVSRVLVFAAYTGMEVSGAVRSEMVRLKELCKKYCCESYESDGIRIGIAVRVEGTTDSRLPTGIRAESFAKNQISANVYVKQANWEGSLAEFRSFLWVNVNKAIWICVEKLQKKKIAFDADKLRQHLSLVEAEFLGEAAKSAEPDAAPKNEPMPVDVYPEDELYPVVIQYRIEGHGNTQDYDRRVMIETLLEEFLSEADLGYLDGGDIGSGTANIFCYLKPGKKGTEAIIQTLRKNGYLDGAVIQETVKGVEKVVWPPDYAGEFSVV